MTHTYAEHVDVTCSTCRHSFSAAVWSMVDATEQPILLERLGNASLHTVICPRCHHMVGDVDAPLMLYRPGATQPLLFSPAPRATPRQAWQQALKLLGRLQTTLGDHWQPQWVRRMPTVPRPLLPLVLADTWPDMMCFLGQHPELLQAETERFLAHLAAGQETDQDRQQMDTRLHQMHRCRELGAALLVLFAGLCQQQYRMEAQGDRQHLIHLIEDWDTFLQRREVATAPLVKAAAQMQQAEVLWRGFEMTGNRSWLDRSDALLHAALAVFTRDTHPREWAQVQFGLGNASLSRYERSGNEAHAEAVERYFRAALDALQRESAWPQWARVHYNMGNLCACRYERSGREVYAEAAVQHYQAALQIRRREFVPTQWAMIQHGLGNLYARRYDYEGEEAHAIASAGYLRAALEEFHLEVAPRPWATLQENMGSLATRRYARSVRGTYDQEAEGHYRNALAQYEREEAWADWARVHYQLGTLFWYRYECSGDQADAETAEQHYQHALTEYAREGAWADWAITQHSLGNIEARRYEHDRQETRAVTADQHYRAALQRYRRESGPAEWAMTQCSLGTLCLSRYHQSGNEDYAREAEERYRAVLDAAREQPLASTLPLSAAAGLTRLRLRRRDWTGTVEAYRQAKASLDTLYPRQVFPASKEQWPRDAQGLAACGAYALARLGRLCDAIVLLEQSRARGLGESLARDRADLGRVKAEAPKVYDRFQSAVIRLRLLEAQQRAASAVSAEGEGLLTPEARRAQASLATQDLTAAVERIRRIPGYERFMVQPAFPDVAEAVHADRPLVYLASTPVGSLALLISRSPAVPQASNVSVEPIWADGLTSEGLEALLVQWDAGEVVGGYLPGQLWITEWLLQALLKALPRLGESMMGPVAARLRILGATSVVLIPEGQLGLFPLHASRYAVGSHEVHLLDEFDVAYAPSAWVLTALRREALARGDAALHLVGLANPLPGPEVGSWAHAELQQIVPAVQSAVDLLKARLDAQLVDKPPPERTRAEALFQVKIEAPLRRIEALASTSPDSLIRAGQDFWRAAALSAAFPYYLPAALRRLADRIPPDLQYTRTELESVLDLLPAGTATPLSEDQATHEALWSTLPHATIAHLACHSSLDLDTPLDSSLRLARGTALTLRDLVNAEPEHLGRLRLAVLSSCQTAIADFHRLPEEAVAVASGFLRGGVPGVVASLWQVDDLSTALLMRKFYALYLHGDPATGAGPLPPVRALRLAQRWLRKVSAKELAAHFNAERRKPDHERAMTREQASATRRRFVEMQPNERPFAHPYYWAAFTFSGV